VNLGWYARPAFDVHFETHGPEGQFLGVAFGGGLVHRFSHDFVGVRFYMQIAYGLSRIDVGGMRLKVSAMGPRLGFHAGHQLSSRLWALGELAPQYDWITVRAPSWQDSVKARDGKSGGWGMRASLGLGWDLAGFTTLSLSATLALPFHRDQFDVADTLGHGGTFSASVLQPGIAFNIGPF
jgi:hypothetical protein